MNESRARLAKALGLLAAAVVALAAAGLLALHFSRQRSLDEISALARQGQARNLSRVDALIRLAAAAEAPLPQRNRAIWALGELRDRQALPALQALHLQEECDHSRLVCQHEVRKAIRKIRGEMSVRHFVKTLWGRWREYRVSQGSYTAGYKIRWAPSPSTATDPAPQDGHDFSGGTRWA